MLENWVYCTYFKHGESSDSGNYRGITITSCVGKLFTLIINERLLMTINVCQIGFRKGYRTADHVFVLNTIINSYFKRGKKVHACFVESSKLLTLSGETDYCISSN